MGVFLGSDGFDILANRRKDIYGRSDSGAQVLPVCNAGSDDPPIHSVCTRFGSVRRKDRFVDHIEDIHLEGVTHAGIVAQVCGDCKHLAHIFSWHGVCVRF